MTYSSEDGLITHQNQVVLLLVFSEAIEGLEGGGILTSPAASVSGLKKLRGTDTYYQVMVSVPPTYYGPVQVTIMVCGVGGVWGGGGCVCVVARMLLLQGCGNGHGGCIAHYRRVCCQCFGGIPHEHPHSTPAHFKTHTHTHSPPSLTLVVDLPYPSPP